VLSICLNHITKDHFEETSKFIIFNRLLTNLFYKAFKALDCIFIPRNETFITHNLHKGDKRTHITFGLKQEPKHRAVFLHDRPEDLPTINVE